MQTLEKQVAERLTRLYIIALSAVALLSLVGQILIQNSLKESLDDAHVVNVAGRQRMLSQRLCKTVILLNHSEIRSPNTQQYFQDIGFILPLWKKSHEGLSDGFLVDSSKNYVVKNSPKINELFVVLDPIFQKIYQNALIIHKNIDKPSTDQKNKNEAILIEILSNERNFLLTMDKIVRQYDLESNQRIDRVKQIELFLFFLTIGVLLVEVLMIFLPFTKYVKEVIKKLTDSEIELQKRNTELSISNQKLNQTKEDLVRTTQEKFELIRKEDNVRSAALMEGQEEERKRLSLELHDGIGQMLTGLKLHTEKLKDLPFSNQKQKNTFDDHQKLIEETIETTRMVSFNLMPSVLTDFGLCATVRLLSNLTMKTSNMKVIFEENLNEKRLPNNLEIHIYRVIQEAINNTVKYANAKQAEIILMKNSNLITLQIIDNGKGFDLKILQKQDVIKNGLSNIQTRIRLLGGVVKISSTINKGTEINIKIPI